MILVDNIESSHVRGGFTAYQAGISKNVCRVQLVSEAGIIVARRQTRILDNSVAELHR